jgi:hypothetical protein
MTQYDDKPETAYDLVQQVANLASGVALAIRAAQGFNLPVEPGVKPGAKALVRWHALLDELLPPGGRP